ncbi:Endoglucanase-like protein [Hapsidospora chrysogenum ATCC 11550]|uniref:Endoglucanase-like protein n=1 Tax=Hapsidospora chrysogenum (strain ATCC 11550 / CBS 779.69 / DSM 880 / IAM 14645 / JCM 23072 / IMI 49137) TaxID=857340 RepID=A0A086SVD1_HAPC1|nr:Endoglucanase-like protein [Hapsidospora chrysogenum ATCC 11550]
MAGGLRYWQLPRRIGGLFSGPSRPLQGPIEARATATTTTTTTSTSRRLREEEELRPIFFTSDDDNHDDNYDDNHDEEAHKARLRAAPPSRRRLPRRARRCLCRCVFRCAMLLIIIFALALTGYCFYKWNAEKARRVPWTPDPETRLFSKRPLAPPPQRLNITNYALPLRTRGRSIVDANGHRFKLASVNWYGASDELFVVGGLNVQHRDTIADTIKRLGFNSVRLPYADELVTLNPRVEDRLLTENPDLVGMRALDVFHAVTRSLTDAGIAVIINNHITSATWCCGADPCDAGWANDHLGPICRVRQTEEDWIRNWETIMRPHVDNPLVIGADLRNEVRGLWGTMPWSKWAAAAERCGNRLLRMNRDWLIVVEGTESANDVSGARERPVRLDVDNRLVYSAHVYSWSGWGSMAGRFSGRSYASFVRTMRWNWGYLIEGDVAPVWVGELGASHSPTVGGHNYWANLFRYLKAVDADFGYWALNPRKPRRNASESYALVKDDYVTPVLDYRMKDMMELMTQ